MINGQSKAAVDGGRGPGHVNAVELLVRIELGLAGWVIVLICRRHCRCSNMQEKSANLSHSVHSKNLQAYVQYQMKLPR